MTAGTLTSRALTRAYLDRIAAIDDAGPQLNAVIDVNQAALQEADARDAERRAGRARGPLHGIPVLVKDNIDVAGMVNSAGSLALLDNRPAADAFVIRRLRDAGAVLLGRSNSGSAVAAAASLAAVTIGTETDGSIICPASVNGVVGLKPTVGLVSRRGIIPLSSSQDTAGPIGRTVADVAALLGGMAGSDPQDPAGAGAAGRTSSRYAAALDRGAFKGRRIGVFRRAAVLPPEVDTALRGAIAAMQKAGAIVVDVQISTAGQVGAAEIEVLLYEFKD